jgi:hypothetical protein
MIGQSHRFEFAEATYEIISVYKIEQIHEPLPMILRRIESDSGPVAYRGDLLCRQ